jgi:hypothetical protein
MRTFSLLVALLVVACVSAMVMSRSRTQRLQTPQCVPPARWVKVNGKWVEKATPKAEIEVKAPADPEQPVVPEPAVPAKKLPPGGVVDQKDGDAIVWQVKGSYQTTPEEARHSANALAQAEVISHFRSQGMELEWLPPASYVSARLVQNSRLEDSDFGEGVGKMYQSVLEVRLTPELRNEIGRYDREYRAQSRMAGMARIVAALVALLAAVAGYFRLDEMTKGYYTGWLRVAAGFLGATAVIALLS